MPRTPIAFATTDISALARSLRDQLTARDSAPSHVEMLNMLARANGHRNFQALRAGLAPEPTPAEPVDEKRVARAAGYFDPEGRLKTWPARTNLQSLCLWTMWARLPRGQTFTEIEISRLIEGWHLFGDRALIRREMIDHRMVRRNIDGSRYERIEQKPPAELGALLKLMAGVLA